MKVLPIEPVSPILMGVAFMWEMSMCDWRVDEASVHSVMYAPVLYYTPLYSTVLYFTVVYSTLLCWVTRLEYYQWYGELCVAINSE